MEVETEHEMTSAHDTPSEPAAQPAATPAAAKPSAPPWAYWLTSTSSSFYGWLMRPRVRLTVIGAMLLLVGGLIATNTVWTLPLVIVGALMVAVAWIGHRLEGRFAVEWGEAGTQLAFNATIKAAQPTSDTPALAPASSGAPTLGRPVEPARAASDVIEGEAHTVEINVTELKALIAAAEAWEGAEAGEGAEAWEGARAGEPAESPARDIRIHRLA
ncbi:MAG: hypothetical protein WAU75_02770, partial [Solirubrobacteraceae bacterium]